MYRGYKVALSSTYFFRLYLYVGFLEKITLLRQGVTFVLNPIHYVLVAFINCAIGTALMSVSFMYFFP